MATTLVQPHVKDFAEWKKVYDSVAGLRASRGALSEQVYHDVNDPNQVTVLIQWDSLASAQGWAGSSEMKEAMQKAGVMGAPVVSFLNAA